MSYGSRSMSKDHDLLFRAKLFYPEQMITVPIYANVDGRWTKIGEKEQLSPESVRYIGPYTAVGPARAAVSKEKKRQAADTRIKGATAELEACAPEWKVME